LADGPVVCYGVNPQRFSSEGFIAIPNKLLGTEYFAIGVGAEDQHSQLGVVGVASDETEVTVTLPNVPELKVLVYKNNVNLHFKLCLVFSVSSFIFSLLPP